MSAGATNCARSPIARDITRVYQEALMELLDALDPADLDRVDKALYNTFGLPL